MGIVFSADDTLTESQREKARRLGITDDEMITRLKRIQGRITPDISVIIPVYNCEKYIRQAVESVKSQAYDSFEIIVIDDGSTDKTLDMLCEIDGISVLIKPNGGTASALNCGIRNAKGRWIKWLSADDMMNPNCLQILMNAAKDENTIYYTNYDIIDENGTGIDQFIEPQRKDTNDLWSYFFGNGSSSLIHRKVFEKCGVFDESLGHSEDYEFWLRATQVYGVKMQLIEEKTIRYRRHPDQLTNKVGGSLDSLIKNKIKSLIENSAGEGKPEM